MMDFKKCQAEQIKLASKVVIGDDFSEVNTIGGAEAYTVDGRMVTCVVICDAKTFDIKEKTFAEGKVTSSFEQEFRAYREGPLLGQALSNLKIKPDVMIFSGEGIMHPRRCGLACHLGVLFDIPSIGISKEAWCGEVKGNEVMIGKEKVASFVKTRNHANPIAVSVGHRISLKSAVEIVTKSIVQPHKMPEPIHLAHKLAKKHFQEKVVQK